MHSKEYMDVFTHAIDRDRNALLLNQLSSDEFMQTQLKVFSDQRHAVLRPKNDMNPDFAVEMAHCNSI